MLITYLSYAIPVAGVLMAAGAVYYARKAAKDREKAAQLYREVSAHRQGRRLP